MHEDGYIGRIEWAVAGRPLPGQRQSGDRGAVFDTGSGTALFAVLDGLGHGAPAADAADRAVRVLAENRAEPLDVLMVLCHRAISDTRGAAVSLAQFDDAGTVHWLGVGNVESRLLATGPVGLTTRATTLLTAGIVGYRLPPNLQSQSVHTRPGDLLLMSTDGIIAAEPEDIDLSTSTARIAADIVARRAKDSDDALVLAARHRGAAPGTAL